MFSSLSLSRLALLAFAVALLLAASVGGRTWDGQESSRAEPFTHESQGLQDDTPAQEEDDPESNLPFLFAVYTITWVAFFAYLVVISRRQREMRREIEALRRVLEEREKQESQE